MTLPTSKMYAVRHGVTNRIWNLGGNMWLWRSIRDIRGAWKDAKECGLVEGELRDHKIVTIKLEEVT